MGQGDATLLLFTGTWLGLIDIVRSGIFTALVFWHDFCISFRFKKDAQRKASFSALFVHWRHTEFCLYLKGDDLFECSYSVVF